MGGRRGCPSRVDDGVASLEERISPALMLQGISSDLQAPEMSPEHTSGVLAEGGTLIQWLALTAMGSSWPLTHCGQVHALRALV